MNVFFKKADQYFSRLGRYIFSKLFIWHVLILGTLSVAAVPMKYLLDFTFFSNTMHTPSMAFSAHIYNNILFYSHVLFAVPAIMLGIWMFSPTLRDYSLKLHRRLGQIYVVGCLVSAVTVIPLALNNGGELLEPKIGFTAMASTWFTLTYFGYTAAINGNVAAHRRWIMRSYAVTYAFVHVNMTYKLFLPFHLLSPNAISVFFSMVSWMTNLLLVEIYLASVNHKGEFWGFARWKKTLLSRNKADKIYWSPRRPAPREKAAAAA